MFGNVTVLSYSEKTLRGGDQHRYSYTEINLAEAHRNLQILLVNCCISSFLIFQNPIVLKQ